MRFLSKNLRNFRKARGLTQLQLAELLNVSVGVVSKWEIGLSSPDIDTIALMAELFDVSIDVLVGYELSHRNMNSYKTQVQNYMGAHNFENCITVVETALRKYPNDYDLVFYFAGIYLNVGGMTHDEKHMHRALELYEKALKLHDPSRHDINDRYEIMDFMARINIALGNVDPALKFLMKNNFHGACDDMIGYMIATKKQNPSEALEYLNRGFVNSVNSLFRTCIGYSFAFCDLYDYEQALDVLLWLKDFIKSVCRTQKVCILDKSYVLVLCEIAVVYARRNMRAETKAYLCDAIRSAVAFDSEPDYDLRGLKFVSYNASAQVTDDFGETALDGIEYIITEQDALTKGLLRSVFEELKAENNEFKI